MQNKFILELSKLLPDSAKTNFANLRLIVGVSGGIDSVLLLHLLHQAQINCVVAHVNFQLRGEESERDMAFVQALAEKFNYPCFVSRVDTLQFAKTQKLSIQVAARNLRYDSFEQLRQSHNADFIATAQHLNDSIETVIYNLTKGCGLRGLHGILPLQGHILRPLHYAQKAEILEFVAQINLAFVEDSSNNSDKYSRNFIRHQIVPALSTLNPQLSSTFGENIDRFRAAEQLLDWTLSHLHGAYWQPSDSVNQNEKAVLNLEKLRAHPCAALLLYEWLSPFGFSATQCQNILAPNAESNNFWLANKYRADYYRGQLIIDLQENEYQNNNQIFSFANLAALQNHPAFCVEISDFSDFIIDEIDKNIAKNVAFFDIDSLHFPLMLRGLQAGDKIQLLGMKGKKKKVSDFFKDLGVAVSVRQKSWLLVDAKENILWVLGYRSSEVAKVDSQTKQLLKISI